MKMKFARVLSTILICIFGFLCVGCVGNDSGYGDNLKERYENGEISYEEYLEERQNSQSVPLYGTKVLYRPDDYNWDDNVGAGNENYYGQYSWNLLQQLISLYGIVFDNTINSNLIPTTTTDNTEEEIKSGYFDSVRYQMNQYNNITLQKAVVVLNDDGSVSEIQRPTDYNHQVEYFEINANTSKQWKWSLGNVVQKDLNNDGVIDETNDVINQAYLMNTLFSDENLALDFAGIKYPTNIDFEKLKPEKNIYDKDTNGNFFDNINFIYSQQQIRKNYAYTYLGTEYTNAQRDFDNYSDYVKALEYAIYCINLDLTPNNITVTYSTQAETLGQPIVTIDGYPATAEKSSATVALEAIQEIFKKIGTYVGITERQQTRLKNWILQNIIGSNTDSTFTIQSYDKVYEQYVKMVDSGEDDASGNPIMVEVLCDANGNTVTEFNPTLVSSVNNNGNITVDRNYEANIEAIISLLNDPEILRIGNTTNEGGTTTGPTINEKYLASHIVDYYGNDFFLSSDNNFPNNNTPLEYQSVALMFRREFEFSNIMMFFKYDAGMDGDEIYDENASITINVYLNQYTKTTNSYKRVGNSETNVFQIEVKDGPFSYGAKENTLMMFGLQDKRENGDIYSIKCGEFNTGIGKGILESITDNYIGFQSVGTPLPLNGNDLRRNYYQLIEPENRDETSETYYSYGILNPAMFAGDDGCDYFEIAFEVIKTTGDYETNYKFCTGLALVA